MAGIIASKTGFYIWYVFVFTVGLIYVSMFTQIEGNYDVKLGDVEDSVVVNKVIRCISEEGEFGEVDTAKFEVAVLKECFGEKYGFRVKLDRKRGKRIEPLEFGNLDSVREVKRYVVVDGVATRLGVEYSKDVA